MPTPHSHRRPIPRDWDRIIRDWTLRLGGLAGVAYETLHEKVDRPYLLALFAGMLGLPSFIRKDEKRDSPGSGARAEDPPVTDE